MRYRRKAKTLLAVAHGSISLETLKLYLDYYKTMAYIRSGLSTTIEPPAILAGGSFALGPKRRFYRAWVFTHARTITLPDPPPFFFGAMPDDGRRVVLAMLPPRAFAGMLSSRSLAYEVPASLGSSSAQHSQVRAASYATSR